MATGTVVGRLIADIDEANSVAVIRKVTGELGATPHQTLANAALRMLQDVTLLSQANPSLSTFQRIRCKSSKTTLSPCCLYHVLYALDTVSNDDESFVIRMKDERTFTVARIMDK